MGQRRYTTAVDIWSIGCVFAEIFLRKPLFSGGSELHQLTLIYELTGEPSEETWPGYDALPKKKDFSVKLSLPKWRIIFPPEGDVSDIGLDMLQSLLTCCPERRVSAEAAGEDPYFWERPYPMDASMMATFQETNSAAHERRTPGRKPTARSLAIGSMAAA